MTVAITRRAASGLIVMALAGVALAGRLHRATFDELPAYWQAAVPPSADLSLIRRNFSGEHFRVEHLLNVSGTFLDEVVGPGGLNAGTQPVARNAVLSTQAAVLGLDGEKLRQRFSNAQEPWEGPHESYSDLWLGVPVRPRYHHHMPAPVFAAHDIPFTLNTDPPSLRDPRLALTLIAAVAHTPVEIDAGDWVDKSGSEPEYRPPDYLAGKAYT